MISFVPNSNPGRQDMLLQFYHLYQRHFYQNESWSNQFSERRGRVLQPSDEPLDVVEATVEDVDVGLVVVARSRARTG